MISRMSTAAIWILGGLPPIFGQDLPAQSGMRITPLVRNFMEAAVPTGRQLAAKIWDGHPDNWRPTRSEFEKAYETARSDFRADALIQLQPISALASQLNVLNTLVNCAYEANRKIRDVMNLMRPTISWPAVSKSFGVAEPFVTCMSKSPARDFRDPVIRNALSKLNTQVTAAAKEAKAGIDSQDFNSAVHGLTALGNQTSLYYLVTAVQVVRIADDINALASINKMGGQRPDNSALLSKLNQLLDEPPDK